MKIRFFETALFGLILLPTTWAAAPVVQSFSATSVQLGQTVTLAAQIADSDADMDYATFAVSGPGIIGWRLFPDQLVPAPGTAAQQSGVSIQQSWIPRERGLYSIRVTVHDLQGPPVSRLSQVDIYVSGRTLPPLVVASGVNQIELDEGAIVSAEAAPGTGLRVEPGANLILWSGHRIVLKPGFHAKSGSHFWAAIDHDMDDYSDLEEVSDLDRDGLPDAWEADHGLNMLNPIDALVDTDGDGLTNLQEYNGGSNPNSSPSGPPSYAIILRLPGDGYYGLKQANWSINRAGSN